MSAARRGNSEIRMCSCGACAPSPTAPRPSRVGIPRLAVKLPSEPPPTAASPSFHPNTRAMAAACAYNAATPAVRSIGGINRPPMERTAGVAALYAQAAAIARVLGWKLGEAAVGGGSDGNFTASLGIPTLDGLGAVGDGAHAPHEHILISELPRRAALIAGLIEAV